MQSNQCTFRSRFCQMSMQLHSDSMPTKKQQPSKQDHTRAEAI